MTITTFFTGNHSAFASGSNFQARSKRKYSGESSDDDVEMQMRVRSPTPKRRTTFPPSDFMTDHSNSASDEDQTIDRDGDVDQAMELPMFSDDPIDRQAAMGYGAVGNGGFGFGPGAEEDETVAEVMKLHPRPSHFTDTPVFLSTTHETPSSPSSPSPAYKRPRSPWSAQPFSTTLRAPTPVCGLLQPTLTMPVSSSASDIEKARAQHGPQCKSIPKLVMSQHPDPITGEMSMWSICGDCGACEKAA